MTGIDYRRRSGWASHTRLSAQPGSGRARLRVACCLSGTAPAILDAARAVAGRARWNLVELAPSSLAESPKAYWDLLIYDSLRWDGVLDDLIRRFREMNPEAGIVIFLPSAGARTCVETGEIEDAVLALADAHLPVLFEQLVQSIIGLRTDRFRGLGGWLSTAMSSRGIHSLRVADMAQRFGLGPRRLEQLCRHSGLPAPRKLLGDLVLLWLSFAADMRGVPTATVARRAGVTTSHLYRLRRRLFPGGAPDRRNRGSLAGEFDAVVLAFVRTCSLPVEVAAHILDGHRRPA